MKTKVVFVHSNESWLMAGDKDRLNKEYFNYVKYAISKQPLDDNIDPAKYQQSIDLGISGHEQDENRETGIAVPTTYGAVLPVLLENGWVIQSCFSVGNNSAIFILTKP